MIEYTVKIIKSHIADILNKYPNVLDIKYDNKDYKLTISFDYGLLYKDWCKFLNSEYEFNIVTVDLSKEITPRDLKRILLAKKFLREHYKK